MVAPLITCSLINRERPHFPFPKTNIHASTVVRNFATAKMHLLFWQLHLLPELQVLTRIVPCGSQLWAVKHHGVQENLKLQLLQGMGSLLRHQISAIHNKRALFPSLQRALIMMWTAYSGLSVTCFKQWVAENHGCRQTEGTMVTGSSLRSCVLNYITTSVNILWGFQYSIMCVYGTNWRVCYC